ncbi:MAG: PqqD family protein [bacterium]
MIETPYSWVSMKQIGGLAKGEIIVYNAPQGKAHKINATALEVLKLCDGEHTVDEISEELAEIYKVGIEVVKEDVRKIIEEFAELKIVGEGPFEG